MLVRVQWLKNLEEVEATGRQGETSLVEEDLATALESFGFCKVDPELNKGSKSKLFKSKKVHTRPVE